MDDFEKYLSKQLENAEFEAEWNKLELERKIQLQFSKKYPRVRLCKARLKSFRPCITRDYFC